MKLSAGNNLKGAITDTKVGAIMAKVTVDLEHDIKIVSVITLESVEELALKVGEEVHAVIKSTEALLSK